MFQVPEKYRRMFPRGHRLYSDEKYLNNGCFLVNYMGEWQTADCNPCCKTQTKLHFY